MGEAYNEAKYDLIESIIDENRPRSVVSVLLDNSNKGYTLFKSEAERNQIISSRLKKAEAMKGSKLTEAEMQKEVSDAESKLIKVIRDGSGNYNPVITDQMVKDARQVVDDQIEAQIGSENEGTPKYKPTSSGGGNGGNDGDKEGQKNQELIAGYKASLRAFGFEPESVKANPNDSKSWTRIERDFGGLRGGFLYEKTDGGKINVMSADGEKVLFTANNPKQLAQYIYGGQNAATAQMDWEKARGLYLGNSGASKPSGGSKSDPLGLGL
jgi:hypothetical protein